LYGGIHYTHAGNRGGHIESEDEVRHGWIVNPEWTQ
jgi:hypothetical protein